jgi:photosystem II stability/assembly factor-like uncharacterized protein
LRNFRLSLLRPAVGRHIFAFIFLLLSVAATAQPVPAEFMGALKWRLLGPFRGGRAVAAAGVPRDPTTFYFGAVNGGIWKTTDAGVVWTPIFDNQPVGSIGALAIAPSDSKVIYAGTGESDIREDLSSGNGVYKSSDAGATWKHIGLDDTRQISRILIDPQNADVVYVGALGHAYAPNAQRGVFKSVDGGAHWVRVLNLGSEVGISDLAICTGNPQLLFAGAWQTHREPWSNYAPTDGPGSALYRSHDGGKSWTRIGGNGLPDGDWGRVGVAVAPDGKRAYALIEAKKDGAKHSGLYRSDDGGATWTLVNSDARLTSRAWYFNRITIDPKNPDVIYMPNVALYRSEDGGKTISVVRGAPGGDDYHELWVDPSNSASMVLATDQGTTISLNRGQTWSSWYNQPTAQFYHVTTDNRFPYTVYGTQQDSGSAAVVSRTDHDNITPRDWFPAGPSESGSMVVDSKDPDIVYLSSTYGPISRFNRRTGLSQDITPWPAFSWESELHERKYRDPWTPVLVASPVEPSTLYLGTQYVMKTTDGGLHWETVSPDLTGSTPGGHAETKDSEDKKAPVANSQDSPSLANAKHLGYGVVFAIAPSPLNRDLIWVGSDSGMIHVTRDGGKTWKDVTPTGISDWSKISMIEASHFDPAVAYAAVDRSRLDDQTPYVYRTGDYGASWQLITDGLTAPAFVRAVREDPQNKGLLFAGTEFRVFTSFDDGGHWQSLQLNLPVTGVRDLTIHGDDLVIATFGRSFWVLDNITPLRQALEAKAATGAILYRPAVAIRVDNDSFSGTPLPPEEPTAPNPASGAMIDYLLPAKAASVRLEVFDAQQNLVRTFSSEDHASEEKNSPKYQPLPVAERWFTKPPTLEKTAGQHRFVWDLTWRSSGGPTADEDSEYRNPSGPKAVPGLYQVRLTVDGKTQTTPLKIEMDPRSPATPQVLAQQFELGHKIFIETIDARRALAEIGSVQKQLADIQQKLTPHNPKQRKEDARPTPMQSAVNVAQTEIKNILANKDAAGAATAGLQNAYTGLASALRVAESGDREVPSQAVAVYQESSQQVKAAIAEWTTYKQTQLPGLNKRLHEANLAPVAIAEIERQVEFLATR